jgi:hypothetical protein
MLFSSPGRLRAQSARTVAARSSPRSSRARRAPRRRAAAPSRRALDPDAGRRALARARAALRRPGHRPPLPRLRVTVRAAAHRPAARARPGRVDAPRWRRRCARRGAGPAGPVVVVPVTPGAGRRPPHRGAAVARAGPQLPATPGPRARAEPPPSPPWSPCPRPTAPSLAVRAPRSRASRQRRAPPGGGRGPHDVGRDRPCAPQPDWRRVGTDRLVRTILTVAASYRRANPGAPRVVVSDLSLPQGGRFGPEYGGLGHASHQNGLTSTSPTRARTGGRSAWSASVRWTANSHRHSSPRSSERARGTSSWGPRTGLRVRRRSCSAREPRRPPARPPPPPLSAALVPPWR